MTGNCGTSKQPAYKAAQHSAVLTVIKSLQQDLALHQCCSQDKGPCQQKQADKPVATQLLNWIKAGLSTAGQRWGLEEPKKAGLQGEFKVHNQNPYP